MKKLLVVAGALLAISALQAQKKVAKKYIIIKGKVQFTNPAPQTHLNKVWLTKSKGWDKITYDSADVAADGTWQLKVDATVPSIYTVDIIKWDRVTVYTDSSMTINCRGYDTAKIKVKNPPYIFVEGSADNNFINLVDHIVYRNYQSMIADSKEMYYADKAGDSAWSGYLKNKDPYKVLSEDFKDRIKVLIHAYRNRPVVVYGLGMLNWEKDQDIIMPILADLNKRYPWFKDGAQMKADMEDKMAKANSLKPGMPVPAISYPDNNGVMQGLEQYKGKYVLIDFWASWCGPCRQAIPKVKELYEKYKDKGLDIVSVSIDDSKKAWAKAMEEEGMPWKQLLSPDKNATMKNFLFSGIPTIYLIDKQGKIVSKYTGFSADSAKEIEKVLQGS
ncbi:TlpA family protein disulfide reductase [Pinibacter aurantiacus]|uniref:TlpA family protein disulfide reductase n=1 Tax=Pinibacter aurantiacus TaxID=2851599 RepID=A0A9E2S828_9BACT|nr:TlpA disulfide reductase family protein [Pinibacter aurantiacus]MBV4357611.1 TlpA family protein disulfide reductase [Pinibacter aurantiacus]